MLKEVNISHPIVSIVHVASLSVWISDMTIIKLLNYPLTVLHDFAYDFIRKLMFCSTNFVPKKED